MILGSSFGLHHDMYMVGPNVRSQQIPASMRAVSLYRRKHHGTACRNEFVGILEHRSTFGCHALHVLLKQPCPY